MVQEMPKISTHKFYNEVAARFPALWPQMPEWEWINIHDGMAPNTPVISDMLERVFDASELVLVLHSEPGVAFSLSKSEVVDYVAKHVLKYEIQVSDRMFTSFVSVSLHGVATSDA
jgi:hypothetical protein